MILSIKYFFLVSFVIFQPSDEYPVGTHQTAQESQRVAGLFTGEKKLMYSAPEQFVGEHVNANLLKGEDEVEGSESDEQNVQELSQNTADTMRKINPLTIADQVSQMFRKGGQKVNIANKSGGGGFMSPERGLGGQETHEGDQSLAMSASSETEDSPIQPEYVRQGVPKIVNKPRSNDYGYSVIVLTGDAGNLPIKVQGKKIKGHGRGTLEDKDAPDIVQNQGVYRTDEAEEKISLDERTPKKEVRVYKQFSQHPNFPVYDEDLNFIPDPFQGILDENYRIEESKDNQKPVLPVKNFRTVGSGMGHHRVHTRRETQSEGSEDVRDEKVACGSWGMGNATESEALSPLNLDTSNNDGN